MIRDAFPLHQYLFSLPKQINIRTAFKITTIIKNIGFITFERDDFPDGHVQYSAGGRLQGIGEWGNRVIGPAIEGEVAY